MILRKPYALLIKHFQKIHLILIFLCAYLFYKTTTLRTFVKDFISTQSYNDMIEPITHHVSGLVIFILLLILATCVALMVLLRYKKKPWKMYLFPFIEYLFLFGVMLYIRGYFLDFDDFSTLTAIMAGRDLLLLAYIPQFAVFILLGVRFLGIDLKKFGFKDDEEYLDIKEEDREEFEVNFEFDKDKVKRTFKKFWRHVKYVYFEHLLVCNTILIIIFGSLVGYTYYYFGILHKTYREGSTFVSNSYQIKVNNSYMTNNKMNGDALDRSSDDSFVIVNVSVKNLGRKRSMNVDRFHLMNRNKEGKSTALYGNELKEYGMPYDKKDMEEGEVRTFILVYRVSKDLDPRRFVLYYQNLDESLLIKKTKLAVEDLRNIKVVDEKNIGIELKIGENDFLISNYNLAETTSFTTYKCDTLGCGIRSEELALPKSLILSLSFESDTFDTKSFIDFSTKYAKINYEDKNGKKHSVDVVNAITRDYNGNILYIRVPSDIADCNKLSLTFTKRDKQYLYHLK